MFSAELLPTPRRSRHIQLILRRTLLFSSALWLLTDRQAVYFGNDSEVVIMSFKTSEHLGEL